MSNHWDGVDVTFKAQVTSSLMLQGGTSTGRRTTDNCEILAKIPEISPTGGPYCHAAEKFLTQAKLLGTYLVPRVGVQIAATVQSLPGPQVLANYTATNAVVAPSLGRPLSGGAANVVVGIVEPGTMYGERLNQLDLRIGRPLTFGRVRARPSIDVYNVFNANPVLTESAAYASWRRPQSILGPRFLELVLQVDF
jgi:hypothetical protein